MLKDHKKILAALKIQLESEKGDKENLHELLVKEKLINKTLMYEMD